MDETQWPNEEEIAELREEGIVPYSKICTRSLILIGLLVSFFLCADVWTEFLENWKQVDSFRNMPTAVTDGVKLLFLLPCALVLAVSLVVILLQTRFLWKFERVSLDFSRLSPFRPIALRKKFRSSLRACFYFLTAIVLAAGAFPLCSFALLELATHISSPKVFVEGLGILAGDIVFVTFMFGIVLGVVSWLYEQWDFRRRNKTSRRY